MKKILITLALMLTVGIDVSQAQTATNSWALGFGLSYPNFYSVNIGPLNTDFGLYLSGQRNFSEHVGLRVKTGYSHLEGQWSDASLKLIKESTNLITGDLDLLYYVVPCAPVSPYLFAGVGANYKNITNAQTALPDDNRFGTQLTVGTGAEFKLTPNWSIVTEFGYHITNSSGLEGTVVPAEVSGRDSYIALSAGVNFFFGKGESSKQCEPCPCSGTTPGTKDLTDYNRIESMIVNHIPKEVVKETITDRYILAFKDDKLVLVGVRFAFDKSDLLPESYELLDKSVELLNTKPDAKFEVQGYTDYIGTEAYNQELSVKRAQTVKAYLVSKGIAQNRLTCVGFGKNDPVEDNATAEGRAMNRRIVFKIIK